MLKLKLQYFGHLMWRANSLEKTLMLGKTEGKRTAEGFHDGLDRKECAGNPGSILGSGKCPGEGNCYPLQYSCLRIPWTEELAGYSPWDCKELDTTEQLSLLGSYPILGFRHSSDGRECICNERDLGSTPGWGRSPGEENGNPLQYSCLENPMDRGAWRATVHGVTTEQLTLSHFPREGGWQRMRWLDVITNSWNWVWANSGRQWRTGKPGVLQSMVSQRVGTDLATEQQQGNWLRAQSWDQTMWLCNLPG